ncbi:thiamine pyrophosphate-binding protein [Streptomyces sp. NPDC090306]|uniref:thiamine pyrophosphate-binding protein n=1 Tax=Streptomyces sp. NPDC090306 TaxID=3365961 RepID=UPI0038104CE6
MRTTEDSGRDANRSEEGQAVRASEVPVRPTVAEALAEAVAEQGCDRLFGLMGDGNMHLFTALPAHGVEVVEVRHESAAVAMAEGYGWTSSHGVGFCSVTHGPGLTHTATSLVVAARSHSPLVMLLAETPADYEGAQRFDQKRFVDACEAPYRRLAADEDPASALAERAYTARELSRPVVLAVAADLLTAPAGGSRGPGPAPVARPGDADDRSAADAVAKALDAAERPVLIAGRGALRGETGALMVRLAQRYGAALATTVPAKGLFDGHPANLGISGGLSHRRAETLLKQADVVLAVGAALDRGTTSSMRLFGGARLLQLVHEPAGGPLHPQVTRVFGDAERTLRYCLFAPGRNEAAVEPWCGTVPAPADCWTEDLTDFAPVVTEGSVDPRPVLATVSDLLPGGAVVVIGNGHSSGFAATLLELPPGGRFFAAHGFGSIGQALTSAVGAALGAGGRKVVVVEGDAAFMMHLQEVETAARSGADLTVFVLNDQALGTEYQRLHAEGGPAELAAVATPDLAAVATALGARGSLLADAAAAADVVRAALAPGLAVVDVRTQRGVLSRHMRWIRRARPGTVMD